MKPSLILSIFILIPNLIKTQLMIYTSSSSPVKKSKEVQPHRTPPVFNSAYHSSQNGVLLHHGYHHTSGRTYRTFYR